LSKRDIKVPDKLPIGWKLTLYPVQLCSFGHPEDNSIIL
jgi:hypothetical protein